MSNVSHLKLPPAVFEIVFQVLELLLVVLNLVDDKKKVTLIDHVISIFKFLKTVLELLAAQVDVAGDGGDRVATPSGVVLYSDASGS